MIFELTTILVVLLSCIFLVNQRKNSRISKCLESLPGPKGLPLIGNSLAASRYPKGLLHYFADNAKKFGRITRYWIGSVPYVFITDPKDLEILLKDTQNLTKSKSYEFIIPWLGNGLVTSTGGHWHSHRKIITPAFHFNILERFVEVFNDRGKVLIDILKTKANGEIFDVFPIITQYTLDAITETSMGLKMNLQKEAESPYVVALNRIQHIAQKRTWNPFLHPTWLFKLTAIGQEFYRNIDLVNSYCMKVINEKNQSLDGAETEATVDEFGKKKRMAFLDLLLTHQKSGFSIADILDEVNTFMFAGHDTTACAITFALYCLSQNEDVQDRMHEEIVDLFGEDDRNLSYADLQSTTYVDQVVKESLRLFPPVVGYSRLLESDIKLSTTTIPAGVSLECFVYMMHRDPEIYPNPEVFDPERFSADNVATRHPFAFAPFSAGPRNCIGQKYAMLEIKLTLIDVLRHFKISAGKVCDNVQTHVILIAPEGIHIRLKPRH